MFQIKSTICQIRTSGHMPFVQRRVNATLYKRHVPAGENQTFCYNKRQKDCLWKQRTYNGLENESLGFIENLHKQ